MQEAVAVCEGEQIWESMSVGEDEPKASRVACDLEHRLADDRAAGSDRGGEPDSLNSGGLVPAAVLRVDEVGCQPSVALPGFLVVIGNAHGYAQDVLPMAHEIPRQGLGADDRKAQLADALFLAGRDKARARREGDGKQYSNIDEPYSADGGEVAAYQSILAAHRGEGDAEDSDEGPSHQDEQ
jgi:hypothetical protein